MNLSPETVAVMTRIVEENLNEIVHFMPMTSDSDATGDVYNGLTDEFTSAPPPAGAPSLVTEVHGEQIASDPARYAALGLSLINSVTLKIRNEGFKPEPGMTMLWPVPDGRNYVVKFVKEITPTGRPVAYRVDATGG